MTHQHPIQQRFDAVEDRTEQLVAAVNRICDSAERAARILDKIERLLDEDETVNERRDRMIDAIAWFSVWAHAQVNRDADKVKSATQQLRQLGVVGVRTSVMESPPTPIDG